MSHPIAVIDFETTGISPGQGARATEVAIVLLEGGVVVDRFQSLMKTGAWIPPFITQLTQKIAWRCAPINSESLGLMQQIVPLDPCFKRLPLDPHKLAPTQF